MNRRFVRSVRRASPDRPGAHRVNRSATDGCSSTSGTPPGPARSPSRPASRPPTAGSSPAPAPAGHRRDHVPGERSHRRRHRRRPPAGDIDGILSSPHTALILNEMRERRDFGCDNGSVSPSPAQQARAAAIAAEIAARLADVSFALPGTLADRITRCGYPGCRCHADPPQRHGPYHQWTRKKNGKTATRILSDEQLADYGPWSATTAACASSSPSSRNSASPSPKPTPAGTASRTRPARASPGPRNRNSALRITWAERAYPVGSPPASPCFPGQSQT